MLVIGKIIRNKEGQYTFFCKDEYDGYWEQGKRHGTGKYKWGNGEMYFGEWEQDSM